MQELRSFTGLMYPQISTTSLEASQIVGSLPPFEEFTEPVCNQVNQEQILTCDYIAPAPTVTSDAHSQQSPSVYTTTTVTTDVNLDLIGLVYPEFSGTAVEPFRHRSLVLFLL